jgi:hypothetical protein
MERIWITLINEGFEVLYYNSLFLLFVERQSFIGRGLWHTEVYRINLSRLNNSGQFVHDLYQSLGFHYYVGYNSFPPMGHIIPHVVNPYPILHENETLDDNSWYYVKYLWFGSWRAEYHRSPNYRNMIEPRTDFEVISEYLTEIKHIVLPQAQTYGIETHILSGLFQVIEKQWKSLNQQGYEVISFNGYTIYFVSRKEISKPCDVVRVQMLRVWWQSPYNKLSYYFEHPILGRDKKYTLTRPVVFPPYPIPPIIDELGRVPRILPDDRIPLIS